MFVSELPVSATNACCFVMPSSLSSSMSPVAVDDHHFVADILGQPQASVIVGFDDFHVKVVGCVLCRADGDAAASHDHHVAYAVVGVFAESVFQQRQVFALRCHVDDVVELDFIVSARDYRFLSPLDCHEVVGDASVEFHQPFADEG